MSRVAYLAVLMVALASVLFGLDWQSAPMSPMPETRLAAQAAIAYAPPPVPNVGPSTAYPADSGAAANTSPSAALAQVAAEKAQLKCNARACARAYQSFQASDCTYQPLNGPRRLCKK